jgi:hypothetical protein
VSLTEVAPDTELAIHGEVDLADAPEDLASRAEAHRHATRRTEELVPS